MTAPIVQRLRDAACLPHRVAELELSRHWALGAARAGLVGLHPCHSRTPRPGPAEPPRIRRAALMDRHHGGAGAVRHRRPDGGGVALGRRVGHALGIDVSGAVQ